MILVVVVRSEKRFQSPSLFSNVDDWQILGHSCREKSSLFFTTRSDSIAYQCKERGINHGITSLPKTARKDKTNHIHFVYAHKDLIEVAEHSERSPKNWFHKNDESSTYIMARQHLILSYLAVAFIVLLAPHTTIVVVHATIDAETGGECVDSDPQNCPFWAATGECKANKRYMHTHCRKSCDRCQWVYVLLYHQRCMKSNQRKSTQHES